MNENCTCECHKDPKFAELEELRKKQQEEYRLAKESMAKETPGINLHGEKLKFAISLLERHPEKTMKIGVGIKHIRIQRVKKYPTNRVFEIERTDGSIVHYGVKKCIFPGAKENPKIKFARAARSAIEPYMQKWKYAKGKAFHHYTVDHLAPWYFSTIVSEFIKSYKPPFETMEYDLGRMVDTEIERAFIAYHNARAEYGLQSEEQQHYEAKLHVQPHELEDALTQ